jgi:osmotically-inducible protein OsmY
MKTNAELQLDVQNAIKWEPLLHAAEIGVTAKDGVVSLTGEVDSYIKKMEAENATKRVIGVKALIEQIEVKIPRKLVKTDSEVANRALKALKRIRSLPKNKVTVKVENGNVTLSGELPWNHISVDAKNALRHLSGINSVTNDIKIVSESHNAIEEKDVKNALKRSFIYDSDINVKVSGTAVILFGTAISWHQKEEAERIAWKTPGIWHVNNELELNF